MNLSSLKPPLVLLTSANPNKNNLLNHLQTEMQGIADVLQPIVDKNEIKLIRKDSINIDDLFDLIPSYREELAVFHFAGHAGDGKLLLEDEFNLRAKDLGRLLGALPNLKLVFLNGCVTDLLANELLNHGVKALLSTSKPVGDKQATEFALKFYTYLGRNNSIAEAYEYTQAYIETKYNNTHLNIIR